MEWRLDHGALVTIDAGDVLVATKRDRFASACPASGRHPHEAMSALEIGAPDQDAANTGGADFGEGDLLTEMADQIVFLRLSGAN